MKTVFLFTAIFNLFALAGCTNMESAEARNQNLADAPLDLREKRAASIEAEEEIIQFKAALDLIRRADFPGAQDAFEQFTKTHTSGSLIPAAYYWLGTAHYAQRHYDRAIAALEKTASVKDSALAPEALLLISTCQIEAGNRLQGIEVVENLLHRYPFSNAAITARQRFRLPPVPLPGPASLHDGSYAQKVAAAIRKNLAYNQWSRADNPRAEVTLEVRTDGVIIRRTLTQSSGVPDWDSAVLRAIDMVHALPLDINGQVPPKIVIGLRPN